MNISLYFINFNDSFYIPFIANHYGKFCKKMVMFDNYSTDNSREIAKRFGIEVRLFGKRGELNDQHYLDVKNHCWKEDRGKSFDYVIVCDADEFITNPIQYMGPAPEVIGYNMVSDNLPINSILEINTGEYSESYSKQAIFNPDAVQEINYVHGCHKNHKVILDQFEKGGPVYLYHYRQIGGIQRLLERHAEYRKRMSMFNKKHRMGYHYMHTDEEKIKEFEILKQNAKVLW